MEFIENSKLFSALMKIAADCRKSGNKTDARFIWKIVQKKYPSHTAAWTDAIDDLLEEKQWRPAANLMVEGIKHGLKVDDIRNGTRVGSIPGLLEDLYRWVGSINMPQYYSSAIRRSKLLQALWPEAEQGYATEAILRLKNRELKCARQLYEKIIHLEKFSLAYIAALCQILLHEQNYPECRKYAIMLAEKSNGNMKLLPIAIKLFIAMRNFDLARKYYSILISGGGGVFRRNGKPGIYAE